MTGLTSSPRLLKGGLIVLAPGGASVRNVISLQYNPDSLSHTYQVQSVGGEQGGERAQPFRLKGPAIQSIKLEAEIDATDALEFPDQNRTTVEMGVGPQLAVLEALVHPSSAELLAVNAAARGGTLEIIPAEAPLLLFVWSKNRIAPVRLTELSITEEAFDPLLNTLRAKVSIGLRVLSTDDLGYEHRGGTLFLTYLRAREALAARVAGASMQSLGNPAIS